MSEEILNVKGDTKKLYQVVNGITGILKENPLPHEESDIVLANKFADFFLEKIWKTETELRKLITEMKTKSFELDPIPTRIIKENLDYKL